MARAGAPVIVASGMGHLAEKIVEVATDSGVPVYEDNSLATVLSQMELGREIPEELYQAIVEIYRLLSGVRPSRPGEIPPGAPAGGRSKGKEEHMSHKYLILDSREGPVAHGVSEDGPEKSSGVCGLTTGKLTRVMSHTNVSLVGESEAVSRLWKDGLSGGREIVISVEPVRPLGEEVRQNLRMPVRFVSYLYPVSGQWKGRVPIVSIDLSCGGLAFFCPRQLEVQEVAEVVIPVTAQPLVLRVKILRERPSPEPIPLYAAEFVDMLREEENMVCEAVFSLQFRHTAEM